MMMEIIMKWYFDNSHYKKELGDLLLHIVFYSKIGSETNDFDIADVANGIS